MKFVAVALVVQTTAAFGASLDVSVENVRYDKGHILVAVCPAQDFLTARCPFVGSAPASRGLVEVRVPNIPPGTYAVQVFQDENDNPKIDRNFLGLPTEGMGFSNDAPFRFGPPTFKDAAIIVGPNGAQTELRLRYFTD
jgi:uncharacterized protein (DUF2141 family)